MVAVAGAALVASADVIYFASGDKLTGTMKSISGGSIVFASDAVGDVTIDASKVAKMDVDKDSEVLFLGNQFNPLTAQGIWQDALAKTSAVYRLVGQILRHQQAGERMHHRIPSSAFQPHLRHRGVTQDAVG